MPAPIISVRNLSKRYRLGDTLAHDTLRDHIAHAAKSCARFFRGQRNGDTDKVVKNANDFWAVKDVSFDVAPGDVLGVVGRNGAGKSTLLKLLSQITEPTSGEICVRGRIASLLEVGTGFHPELSGRENIFLNGAILGMTHAEIKNKFDEIVAFSEVEQFLDTPVKRYSSGMYVRLAFAVAAHLEPEILVVDEVLAVGDAQFQKKCLGKMQDLAHSRGRTVLFVSHNMTAVRSLCNRAILLERGSVVHSGEVDSVLGAYLSNVSTNNLQEAFTNPSEAPGNEHIRVKAMRVVPEYEGADEIITVRTPVGIEVEYWTLLEEMEINLSLHLWNINGECVFASASTPGKVTKGLHKARCFIPGNLLNDGAYSISVLFVRDRSSVLYKHQGQISFEVADYSKNAVWAGKWPGAVRPLLKWDQQTVEPAANQRMQPLRDLQSS